MGADADHVHGPDDDHDHDHDSMDLLPLGGSTSIVLTSVGIDVGSSGTQIVFARVEPGAVHAGLSSVVYQSPVFLTPFADGDIIDIARLDRIIDASFEAAGLSRDDIDCGVVILTGAARERQNARAITELVALTSGDIVSAAAGHHMEARIAAHGSGAVQRSADFGQRYLNVDIGGATTKLAICDRGVIVATAALAIGGRLVATDARDVIVRLEPDGEMQARALGFDWRIGGLAPWGERKAVGEAMAAQLVEALRGRRSSDTPTARSLTGDLPPLDKIDGLIVSGGVGEYVYGRETRSFSDVGLPLGRALGRAIHAGELPWPLLPTDSPIRATALGASSYTVQLSGSTGLVTAPARLLPRRNLPVAVVDVDLDTAGDDSAVERTICAALTLVDQPTTGTPPADLALGLRLTGVPEHPRLLALARGIARAWRGRLDAGRPLYVLIDADIAAALGAILTSEVGVTNDVLVLDGIELADLDHIDLGRIRLPSGSVPVTIKSLVFADEAGHKTGGGTPKRQSQPQNRPTVSPVRRRPGR